ncbi:hypothetical protein PAPYR_3295 [Paratrimastix pyriformis]|uniref:Uncharacterized protein n=1 Tax=Paratrimastix pyriformis TaxID=342808 RepID=A0ABQ8UN81_9EUKA|nr:hypothetical protein PAPYR_3295 [Paratrimastix pyriformis]
MGASAASVKASRLVSAYSDTKQYLEKSEPTKFSFLSLFARSVGLKFRSFLAVPFSSHPSLAPVPLGTHFHLWYVSTVLRAYRNPPPAFSLAKCLACSRRRNRFAHRISVVWVGPGKLDSI